MGDLTHSPIIDIHDVANLDTRENLSDQASWVRALLSIPAIILYWCSSFTGLAVTFFKRFDHLPELSGESAVFIGIAGLLVSLMAVLAMSKRSKYKV